MSSSSSEETPQTEVSVYLKPRGRGAALLSALSKQKAQATIAANAAPPPGKSESTISTSSSSGASSGSGRGRYLQSILQIQNLSLAASSSSSSVISSETSSSTASHDQGISGCGRGKRLASLLQQKTETSKSVEDTNTEPIQEKIEKYGSTGKVIPTTANYIRLNLEPGKGLFEYEIQFDPPIDARNLRHRIFNKLLQDKVLDGNLLYLPVKLPQVVTKFDANHPVDNSPVEVTIKYKRQKRMSECVLFFNMLFRKIFRMLCFVQMGRKNYSPTNPFKVLQHRLEIWPGYVTAIDEYDGGFMLCIDASHKFLRMDTVRSFMITVMENERNLKQDHRTVIANNLLGAVVMTKYNNKTYRVDDILWDLNPSSTFQSHDGTERTYIDYYKKEYDLNITDLNQPLLAHRARRRLPGQIEKVDQLVCLVPELCHLTGLTDAMVSDFRVMKDIAAFTRLTPVRRLETIKTFCNNVNKCQGAVDLLKSWGLSLDPETIHLDSRVLPQERILFGKNTSDDSYRKQDWGRSASMHPVLRGINLNNWVLLFTSSDRTNADTFVSVLRRLGSTLGVSIQPPQLHCLQNDATVSYHTALNAQIRSDTQLVVVICPTIRDDRYSVIKKICCADKPVPSQVVLSKTLRNSKNLQSIMQKIALQINCKLGGELWTLKFPRHKWMVCGMDVYHDGKKKSESVVGFVTTLNESLTKYYSQVYKQERGIDLIDGLKILYTSALKRYYDENGDLPDNIIVFRDGVGDGDLKLCKEYELPQIEQSIKTFSSHTGKSPKITFIVVQKRINTKIFAMLNGSYENAPPGTITDREITRRQCYDFFLTSQYCNQGSVTPSHYIVVHDSNGFSPDHIQRLSYKLCHMYFNWAGTIRIPAPCQYAHKLAYLVGENVKKTPSEKLADKLYFL